MTLIDATGDSRVSGVKVNISVFGTAFIAVGSSGSDGAVGFGRVPAGRVRFVCRKNGYDTFSGDVSVGPDETVSVTVKLASTLDVIGSVRARSSASPAVKVVSERSLIRRVAPDLVEALRALGGVSIGIAQDGLGLAVGLRGRDPSQSSATLNGASLGSNAAVLAVNTDLLSQASIDGASDSIHFSTLSPSAKPKYGADLSTGGYGTSLVKGTSQGTLGETGFAFGHSIRGAESALNGQTYADASGLTYRHVGTRLTTGNYGKIAFSSGAWTFAVGDMVSRAVTRPVPTYFSGPVPAGYGPGEVVEAATENPVVVATGPLGDAFASVSISGHRYSSRDDASNRVIFGVPAPQVVRDDARGYGFDLNVQEALSEKRSLSIAFQSDSTQVHSILEGAFSNNAVTVPGSRSSEINVTHAWRANRRLNYDIKVQEQSNASRPVTMWNIEGAWEPTSADRYRIAARAGQRPILSQSFVQARGFAPPADAVYDCAHRIVSIATPGDEAAVPSIRGIEASWSHSTRAVSFSVAVYNEDQHGLLITDASVPAILDTIAAPSGYLGALLGGFAPIGGCGGSALATSDVYYVHNVAGESARYRGFDISAEGSPLRNVTFEAEYTASGSVLTALDPRLRIANSPYIPGAQIPNVPLHTASATVDWAVGRFEFLANVQRVSANNTRNLPAYSVMSLAASRAVGPYLRVAILATNVSGSYNGTFVSPRYAIPLATLSGPPLDTLAAPLVGPRLFVNASYRFAKS